MATLGYAAILGTMSSLTSSASRKFLLATRVFASTQEKQNGLIQSSALLQVMVETGQIATTVLFLILAANIFTIMLAAPFLIFAGFPLSYFNENALVLALSSVLVGAGLACSNAPSTQLILRFAPEGMSAISTSLDITFARLGGIATVTVLAEVEIAYVIPAMCILCFIAAICALTTRKGLLGAS